MHSQGLPNRPVSGYKPSIRLNNAYDHERIRQKSCAISTRIGYIWRKRSSVLKLGSGAYKKWL